MKLSLGKPEKDTLEEIHLVSEIYELLKKKRGKNTTPDALYRTMTSYFHSKLLCTNGKYCCYCSTTKNYLISVTKRLALKNEELGKELCLARCEYALEGYSDRPEMFFHKQPAVSDSDPGNPPATRGHSTREEAREARIEVNTTN